LRQKLYLLTAFIGVLAIVPSLLLGIFAGLDAGGSSGMMVGIIAAIGLNVLWLAPAFIAIPFYCRSLQYEIQDDEVIVRAGIITKSVKHVPYRTVTNLKAMQDPFDRLLGIGTLKIQTAGMSGQQGAEESLIGLPNFQEIYEQVATALRRYRGAMSPTQAEDELAPAPVDGVSLAVLVDEVRRIRQMMENRQ